MSALVADGGGLTVGGADRIPGTVEALDRLVGDGLPGRLVAGDSGLWGDAARAEASIRLGWLNLADTSRDLLPRLATLRAELRAEGLDHVVLAGMGGSSLAPEVITRSLGVELTVLDTTDPHQVRAALGDLLDRTVVVVSSKSGGTVETDSHRRAYWAALAAADLDPGRHIVVVTDPGSPLEAAARADGVREVFLADPDVGGRYSALTAFGLVPSALAGVDVGTLLDEAAALHATLAGPNPALTLGAALGAAAVAGRDKLAVADDGSGIVGLGDWIEQLVAESTGKDGRGILPVVLESPTAPPAGGPDVVLSTVGGALRPGEVPGGGAAPDLTMSGPLGAQFLAWEYATAVAGHLIGINPFDQPNVQESKDNTNRLLASGLPTQTSRFTDGAIEVYFDGAAPEIAGVAPFLAWFLGRVEPTGYLAAMAYLDRFGDAEVAGIRPLLAERTARPVTFGWGPRFLHSTGQYHKGGPQLGSFLQITGAVTDDLEVPGRPYTFGQLQAAQAAGDRQALGQRGRPVLWLHLTDRAAGIAQLLEALK